MFPKIFFAALFSTLALTVYAQSVTLPGVVDLDENTDGSYTVTCANAATGVISFEESNICVYSKANDKSRCDHEANWGIDEAAVYICS